MDLMNANCLMAALLLIKVIALVNMWTEQLGFIDLTILLRSENNMKGLGGGTGK